MEPAAGGSCSGAGSPVEKFRQDCISEKETGRGITPAFCCAVSCSVVVFLVVFLVGSLVLSLEI
jgi:hypothetical protein